MWGLGEERRTDSCKSVEDRSPRRHAHYHRWYSRGRIMSYALENMIDQMDDGPLVRFPVAFQGDTAFRPRLDKLYQLDTIFVNLADLTEFSSLVRFSLALALYGSRIR